jgi:predicted GNAT superfamily acetyltransferase
MHSFLRQNKDLTDVFLPGGDPMIMSSRTLISYLMPLMPFDPLQIRNAHFSIVRLGAIARRYLPDSYGRTSSPLHRGMPTDRLLAEWWWSSSRVQSILGGETPTLSETRRISTPSGSISLSSQARLRNEFESLFGDGWIVSSVERKGNTGAYILSRDSAIG